METLRHLAAVEGLAICGAFHPKPGDGVPPLPGGDPAATLALLGLLAEGWAVFAASPEAGDGASDPLDRWSRRVVGTLAVALGAAPLFPFGGPPFLPFQRWAQRAGPFHPSPIGMLIHPDWGLWQGYRGALAFASRLDLPLPDRRPSPCESCAGKPCLTACPVGAFTPGRYDVAACAAHVASPTGSDCADLGCRARRACPVGAAHRYAPPQAAFHMRAFLAGQREKRD